MTKHGGSVYEGLRHECETRPRIRRISRIMFYEGQLCPSYTTRNEGQTSYTKNLTKNFPTKGNLPFVYDTKRRATNVYEGLRIPRILRNIRGFSAIFVYDTKRMLPFVYEGFYEEFCYEGQVALRIRHETKVALRIRRI